MNKAETRAEQIDPALKAARWGIVALTFALLFTGCNKPVRSAPPGVRVVSLAPSMTEIVCAIGGADLLVGRTSACDYPPEAAKVKVIGGFGAPSMELLIAAAPTLVLDVDLDDETTAKKIESLGMRRAHIKCRTLDDIPEAIRTVGALIGRDAQAKTLADDLKAKIEALRTRAASETNGPAVYIEIWHDPATTAGRNSFLSELVRLAGGRNIGDEIARDYFTVSSEWILSKDPEAILCLYPSTDGAARKALMGRSSWRNIKAVKTGAVYDGFDVNLILRPGPRVLESIELIRKRLLDRKAP